MPDNLGLSNGMCCVGALSSFCSTVCGFVSFFNTPRDEAPFGLGLRGKIPFDRFSNFSLSLGREVTLVEGEGSDFGASTALTDGDDASAGFSTGFKLCSVSGYV